VSIRERAHQRHAGIDETVFERLGVAKRDVIDFSVNASPLGPPPHLAEVLRDAEHLVRQYPSIDGSGIVTYYTERFGLKKQSILAGNGSTEFIYLIPRALGPSRVVIPTPTLPDYTRACRVAGSNVTWLRLSADDAFAAPPSDRMHHALRDADALFIANPTNPTGTTYAAASILRLAETYPDKWFIVDEAYGRLTCAPDETSLLRPECIASNVLVISSLTELFALPGLRMGCVVGHPDTVAWLRTYTEPWTVNTIADRVAARLAECTEYERQATETITAERSRVHDALGRIPGITPFEPTANFVLARWEATPDLDDLLRALLGDGCYVRDCRDFPGLEGGYFRIAVRTPEQNDWLVSSIERASAATR
jgi:threonine-phosphate decarboxylase